MKTSEAKAELSTMLVRRNLARFFERSESNITKVRSTVIGEWMKEFFVCDFEGTYLLGDQQ